MLSPKFFIDKLGSLGIDFFAGVPDSLLKNICAYISDNMDSRHNIIAANEGGAVGLAAGYHLATGKIGCVYMQNSGEGNIINPLASLTDPEVYDIPMLLLIGWRGRPGVKDEPQHVKQGKVTTSLLDTMGIRHVVLGKDESEASAQMEEVVSSIRETNEVYAIVIEKDTFEAYAMQNMESNDLTLSREDAIRCVAGSTGPSDVIVATTGMISRELFEYRESVGEGHERDFLTVGAMGHASQIALGIALEKPSVKVWCFDGDGATLMHMGGMTVVASKAPENYIHVVFNNGAHDSVGGQPTVGLKIDLPTVAGAVGYKAAYSVDTIEAMRTVLDEVKAAEGPVFMEVRVRKGNRKDLGRPTTAPVDNKMMLMNFLNHC